MDSDHKKQLKKLIKLVGAKKLHEEINAIETYLYNLEGDDVLKKKKEEINMVLDDNKDKVDQLNN